MRRTILCIPLLLCLGGCAGLRLPDGTLDTARIASIAGTAADAALAGAEMASDPETGSSDWVGLGVGALLSIALAGLGVRGGHALWRSGRGSSA